MSTLTTEQLEMKVLNLETQIKGLVTKINNVTTEVNSKTNVVDANRNNIELRSLISDNGTLITNLEEKLAKVILPAETRFYLSEGEVTDFQSNFNQLKAMMISFEKLYKNLVAYSSNL